MIEDACRGVNCENIKNVKNRMRDEGVHCVTSEQVVSYKIYVWENPDVQKTLIFL